MEQPAIEKKPKTDISWENDSPEMDQIAKWRDSAFHAAVEKLKEEHGNTETVIQTGEAFGRGLHACRVKEKSPDWTIETWREVIENDVLKPLGTEFTFTKVSHDVATTFMNRDPLRQMHKESTVASLFNYGVMRGLFLSAFPQGELLMNRPESKADQPEYIFKTHASAIDRFERERVKHVFSTLKKDDGA
jgi:hypothetical protein